MGAIFGAAVGHQFDRGLAERGPFVAQTDSADQYRVQMAFFTAAFSVMGHLAKADGRVNEAEIDCARKIMQRLELNEDMRDTAMRLFGEGKRAGFPLDEVLNQFLGECHNRFALLRLFVEIQLELALADGALHASEERLLLRLCERLHFSRFEFHALKTALEAQLRLGGSWRGQRDHGPTANRQEPSLEEAYATLSVKPSTDDEEIRRAYRRLLSRHHPDKQVAEGRSEQQVQLANEKTRQVRKAWETIRKARNI